MGADGTALAKRGRFISVEEGFNISRPALGPRGFDAERDRALDPATPSGWLPLDLSGILQTPYPATSPLLLAKYGRIRAGERLVERPAASAQILYVIRGAGRTRHGDLAIDWERGDLLCLPGGVETAHEAGAEDCVLYAVTDEPMLAFASVDPAPPERAPIEPVRYPRTAIEAELDRLANRDLAPDTPGRALFLTSERMEARRTCTPSLTLTLNLVLPGEAQPPHKHNAAAIVFITRGGSCRSVIDGCEFPWTENSVLLTPPNAVHSHDNGGDRASVALIVQDGGLHYHCRTMGFSFA